MKKLHIIGNWKANKTRQEAEHWLKEISELGLQFFQNKDVIICPSYTLLSLFEKSIKDNNLLIKVGAQDISAFSKGAHTGEVNGEQIKEFADYVIIGHSERRKMGEDETILKEKAERAKEAGLKVIYCVSEQDQKIPQNVDMVAYEPIFAIGSGTPDTPENADQIAKKIKEETSLPVLYGGSVTSENVKSFIEKENIDGVLVGGASLNASEFFNIINN